MRSVAALFVRADSVYKTMAGVDCYDINRDALTWPGGCPAVCHPPCRGWGALRHFARPRPGEMDLARWAVSMVRQFGGVLEHPAASMLWSDQQLPAPGRFDGFGGWTMGITQHWFGHRAEKRTLLYIVGVEPMDIPTFPLLLGEATHVVSPWSGLRAGMPGYRPQLRKAEREHTPPVMAQWLVEIARLAGDFRGRAVTSAE